MISPDSLNIYRTIKKWSCILLKPAQTILQQDALYHNSLKHFGIMLPSSAFLTACPNRDDLTLPLENPDLGKHRLYSLRPIHVQLGGSRFGCGHERIIGKTRVAGSATDANITDHPADREAKLLT
jgi:hypothetical protein